MKRTHFGYDDDEDVIGQPPQIGHISTLDTNVPHPNKKKNPIGFTIPKAQSSGSVRKSGTDARAKRNRPRQRRQSKRQPKG